MSFNAHGDVTQLTSSTGAVVKDYHYDAFGEEKSLAPGDQNPFRYCGEQYDQETGNYYLRARYYAPGVGRFTQEDSHWGPDNMIYGDNNSAVPDITAIMQSFNLYVYALNNPLRWIDPSGKAVTDWDKAHLSSAELSRLQWITDKWGSGTTMQQNAWSAEADGMRTQYRMPYEYTDASGRTYIDSIKLALFRTSANTKFGANYGGVLVVGGIATQVDSPLPGPADLVGAGIVVVGSAAVWAIHEMSKGNPRDLEKGMTAHQKGAFQREIEDWKRYNGMRPNDNVPWEILCALAEEVREMFNK